MKIFMYVMAAIGVTGVIFGAARYFARGKPATMTKEYQEASNEYLKVCLYCSRFGCSHADGAYTRPNGFQELDANMSLHYRARTSSPSLVSRPPATSAPEWSRASPRASKCAKPQKSRERKKCSRISGRSRHGFRQNRVEGPSRGTLPNCVFPCVGL